MAGQKRKAIIDFLASAFTLNELHRWLVLNYPELEGGVNWNEPMDSVSFEVVGWLLRRGHLDSRFFEHLRSERSKRSREIQTLCGLYAAPNTLATQQQRTPPPEGEEWDVFISYAPEDRELVYPLALALHENDVRVFFDEWLVQYGAVKWSVIEAGLLDSSHGLVAITAKTALEGWAAAQYYTLLDHVVTRDRLLIPVLLGSEERIELPPFLATRRCADLRGKDGDAVMVEIDNIVRALHGRPPGPPGPPARS